MHVMWTVGWYTCTYLCFVLLLKIHDKKFNLILQVISQPSKTNSNIQEKAVLEHGTVKCN